jgi:hypothetical protein
MSKLITGDETGLLKYIDLHDSTYKCYGIQSRENGIIRIEHLSRSIFILIRKNGQLELWQKDKNELLFQESQFFMDNIIQSARILSNPSADSANTNIVFITHDGHAKVVSFTPLSNDSNGSYKNSFSLDANSFQTVHHLCNLGPLHCVASCVNSFAIGGQENDVTIFDRYAIIKHLQYSNIFSTEKAVIDYTYNTHCYSVTGQQVWKAKNVPLDKLSLRVPIWVTALAFFNANDSNISTGATFATGTG